MQIYDVSVPLSDATPTYPGDPGIEISNWLTLEKGVHANVTVGEDANGAPFCTVLGAADRKAAAVMIPHELRGILQRIVGCDALNFFGHEIFYLHGKLLFDGE